MQTGNSIWLIEDLAEIGQGQCDGKSLLVLLRPCEASTSTWQILNSIDNLLKFQQQ